MKIIPETVDDITAIIAAEFPSFGGGKKSNSNPITNALSDNPASFALGVDIKDVVTRVIALKHEIDNADNH